MNFQEAEKSIRFYRHLGGKANDYEVLQFEMNKLKTALGSAGTTRSTKLKWSDFTAREARKAMIIGIVLVALNQFCGCFAMLNYTASIFKESGSSMSPNMSAIVVGIIQLVGSSCPPILVDRAGRKVISFLISGFMLFNCTLCLF